MDFESLHLLIIALLPSVGTLIGALVMFFKIVMQFKGLRKEVRDDKVIDAIHADNKRLNAMHRQTLEKIDELEARIETLALTNQELTSAINRMNRGE